MRGFQLIVILLFALTAAGAPAQPAVDDASRAPSSPIAARQGADDDLAIASRIEDILAEIGPLTAVEVRVAGGVVTLGGTAAGADDIKRAETIANRVSGVVTVQNEISRDTDITASLTPTISQFEADMRSLLQSLPLLGVAAVIGLIIALAGYMLASVGSLWRWLMPNPFLAELAATAVRFASVLIGLVVGLNVLGATAILGGVLGGAGVVGIALGFAVRDTIENYVSSLMLSLRQPFRANDHVLIEGQEGRVVRLTSRATILMTLDGNHLRIPNSIVYKSVILNYSRNSERRFTFALGIDAEDDPIRAMSVGLAAINGLGVVLDSPKAVAVIEDVGDSNIILRFFAWVDQSRTDFLKGRSLAINVAAHALTSSGFALPEPIYRLRFDEKTPLPLAPFDTGEKSRSSKADVTKMQVDLDADTSPDTHVDVLVSEERQETGKGDLLDSSRPIE